MTRVLVICSAVDPTGSVKQLDLALPQLQDRFDVVRQVVSSPHAVALTDSPRLIHTVGATAFRAMRSQAMANLRPGRVPFPPWLASGAASVEPSLGFTPGLTATFSQSEHERDWSARLTPAPMQFSAKVAVTLEHPTPAVVAPLPSATPPQRGGVGVVSGSPQHTDHAHPSPLGRGRIGSAADDPRVEPSSRYILAAGGFDAVSNLKHIVWAFDVLKYTHPQLHLVLLGDGPQRTEIEHFAASLGYDDLRVRCVGHQSDITPFMRTAVQVWGSHTRGGTKFLLEAMASGVPVIATRTADTEQIVRDGENGRLVPADRPVEMARVAHSLLTSPDRAHTLVVAGQNEAAGYPVADLADALAGVYHTLTSLAPVRPE